MIDFYCTTQSLPFAMLHSSVLPFTLSDQMYWTAKGLKASYKLLKAYIGDKKQVLHVGIHGSQKKH